MIELLVGKLTDAAIRVMSQATRRRGKPPRHYEYHDLGNANYVLKYTGKRNQPIYRCVNCDKVLQLRQQRRTAAGSTLYRWRYRYVNYLVCVNGHVVPVPVAFEVRP